MPSNNAASDLLNHQLEQAARQRKPRPPKKGVEPSRAAGIRYNAQLQKIVKEINQDINDKIMPLLRQLNPQFATDSAPINTKDTWLSLLLAAFAVLVDKWTSPQFSQLANTIAINFVKSANQVNRERFNKNMRGFGIDVFGDSPDLVDYVNASVFDNVRLIKSIPEQYLTQVQSIIMTNVRSGNRSSDMVKLLRDQFGITQRRAKFIARDQTSKLNGQLTQKRQIAAGFQYFQWLTSKDPRVRDRHRAISRKLTAYGVGIYRWDNPPLSARGSPIIPGQDFRCRCVAVPQSDEQVLKNQREGKVRKGVYN